MIRLARSERVLSASVPNSVARAVRALARRDERTTSAYIKRLLVAHVRDVREAGDR